jgi:tetratricopeptide (TPR) repeat protein
MGRWAWCSDAWDFDGDGFADIYIVNGMISGSNRQELNSFFWRQVVANSPKELRPNDDYEQGWSAINELIRSDGTWSGFERNVFYLNNRDGTFSDISGIVGMDFIEDSRSFALGDFDQDGRVEVVLKNRNAPQVRILKNAMRDAGAAIAFRLRGTKSNRDAIGAAVTVETESGRQTRWLQAGSGFLAQHSKELFFGLGESKVAVTATIRWPSGLTQNLRDLPMNHRIWIEEGAAPARMEPFRKPAAVPACEPVASAEILPGTAETWLLAPVAAPDFSLPDLGGREQRLSVLRGNPVLLHFWSAESEHALVEFERTHVRWVKDGLQLLTIAVNEPGADREKSMSPYQHFTFTILRASADVVAIYNIFYRYIFDWHRDLTLPTSFLIDAQGAIVKIYQGPVDARHFETDFRNIPHTADERVAKALPFPGLSESTEFGRNYLSIGSVFFERGYLEQAEFCFQQALRDEPSSAEAYYGLGSVYLQQQKNAEARENFERSVRLQASYPGTVPRAWSNLGILAAREGSSDEAVRNFRRALEIDPDYQVAWVNLGSAYRQKKDWKEAAAALRQALALRPEDPEANYGLGMVFAQLNETEQAYLYIQKALAARPVYPEALNNLGVLYLRTKRVEEAEKSFQEAIRVAPAFELSYLNLAKLYALQGDSQRARAVLLELLKQHPGHAQAERELSQLPQ